MKADAQQPQATQPPPVTALAPALHAWQQRLTAGGVACRATALAGAEPGWTQDFADAPTQAAWAVLRQRVTLDHPVALGKAEAAGGSDLMIATAVQLPSGAAAVVGASVAPPHNERTVQLVLLSLGWLQLALSAASLRTTSVPRACSNCSATSARSAVRGPPRRSGSIAAPPGCGPRPTGCDSATLTLFEVRRGTPRWWVAADTAWAEKAAPAVEEATEVAARATVEMQEVAQGGWWAMPVIDQGEVQAVLAARSDADLPAETLNALRGASR